MQKAEFAGITADDEYSVQKALGVITASFKTVAESMQLTEEKAPTNPAFMKRDRLVASLSKGVRLFSLKCDGEIIGTIALERSPDDAAIYFIERLAVLPEMRHRGFGAMLMDHACALIKAEGGKKVSIGIIDSNTILKKWYMQYGFVERAVKSFEHLPYNVCFMDKEV